MGYNSSCNILLSEHTWPIARVAINQCRTQGKNGWEDSLVCQTKKNKSSNLSGIGIKCAKGPQDSNRSRTPRNKRPRDGKGSLEALGRHRPTLSQH